MQVNGWQTPMRNEREKGVILKVQHSPDIILQEKGMRVSIHVGAQKMVSYA